MVNQDPVINIVLLCFLDMDSTSFDVDFLVGIVDLIMHSCYSVELFFCARCGEFEVVWVVYCSRVEAVKTAVG